MSGAVIGLILVLSVIFVIIVLDALAGVHRKKIVTSTNDAEQIEMQLRRLLKKNPDSEIYIINNKNDAESEKIAELLCRDFPQIHIIKRKDRT